MTIQPQKESLAFLLNSSTRYLNSAFERRITEAGLGLTPGEARALLTVAAIDGSKQADIALRIGLEPMTVCTYLDKLESLALVERRPNPDDRRSKCIYLTDTCDDLLASVRREVDSLIGVATDGFSQDDLSRFHELLTLMQKNLHCAVTGKSFSGHQMSAPMPAMSVRRTATLGAMLTMLGPISMAIYTPAMPELVRAFATTEAAIKMSLTLYFGGFALSQLLAGALSDAFGRRKATILFLLVYLTGGVLAAFAPNIETLLIARLIQGIGASVGVTVARAVVRDQYTGPQASGILNLIGIMLAVGPAAGPTIGGLSLMAFGWQSVFVLMLGFGVVSIAAILLLLRETTLPDPALIRPGRLLGAYRELLSSIRFLLAAFVLAGTVGALFAQSTMLPFILINEVGLTPTAFGIGMLMQSGFYFFGSIALRYIARWFGERPATLIGLFLCTTGAALTFLSVQFLAPAFLLIMGPVAVATFGLAQITPHIITIGMAPFPHIAGSASAMMGFIQMSAGFAGGMAASIMGSPLASFGIVIPAMQLAAVASYIALAAISRRHT